MVFINAANHQDITAQTQKKTILLRLMQCTKKTKAKSSEITLAIYHI